MVRTLNLLRLALPAALVGGLMLVVVSCGGSDDSSPTSTTAPAATPVPTATTAPDPTPEPTATEAPAPTATQAPAPTATTAPSSGGGDFEDPTGQFDQELLAAGKVVFDETAGGVGCAFCHGLDGKGDGPAGVGAPSNRGASLSQFEAAITEGESGAMDFLDGQLTRSEKAAVIEYLAWLATQP